MPFLGSNLNVIVRLAEASLRFHTDATLPAERSQLGWRSGNLPVFLAAAPTRRVTTSPDFLARFWNLVFPRRNFQTHRKVGGGNEPLWKHVE